MLRIKIILFYFIVVIIIFIFAISFAQTCYLFTLISEEITYSTLCTAHYPPWSLHSIQLTIKIAVFKENAKLQ